jgi:hypothetical protein
MSVLLVTSSDALYGSRYMLLLSPALVASCAYVFRCLLQFGQFRYSCYWSSGWVSLNWRLYNYSWFSAPPRRCLRFGLILIPKLHSLRYINLSSLTSSYPSLMGHCVVIAHCFVWSSETSVTGNMRVTPQRITMYQVIVTFVLNLHISHKSHSIQGVPGRMCQTSGECSLS